MRRLINILIAALMWCSYALLPAMAQEAADQNIAEYRVRIAYIFSFMKFVEWPEEVSPIKAGKTEICIYGDNDFRKYLDAISKTTNSKLPIEVREVSPSSLAQCHLLFIGNDVDDNANTLTNLAKKYPILTISEINNFADRGGIVEIIKVSKNVGLFSQDKVNLRINMRNSEAVNLVIDARILQVATELIK